MLNNYFSKIYCINLDRRPDRWEKASEMFNKLGIQVERFPAIDGNALKDGKIRKAELACLLSHLEVIKKAKEEKLGRILILEDDTEINENINIIFKKNIPDFSIKNECYLYSKYPNELEIWDMLYLGCNNLHPIIPITNDIAKITFAYTTHAYAINYNIYDLLIETLSQKQKQVDVYYAELHSKINAYCFAPALAWQREDFSDVVGRRIYYHNIILKKPTFDQVNAIDLSETHKNFITNYRKLDFFNGKPGVEHYKLLAWISTQFSGITISEVGTLDGCGALALSYNKNNKVNTFDIHSYPDCNRLPDNVSKKLVYDNYMDEVIQSKLIFYDAKHEGKEEQEFLDELLKRNWKGILIWDDIHFNKPMKDFWNKIKLPKEDWTDIGHSWGTGVVFIS